MADERAILGRSVERLRQLVEPLDPEELRARAYPSEWTIAQVLSHLGSADTISTLWINQALRGEEVDPNPIWDLWNAKAPETAARDALEADRAFLAGLDAVTEAERAEFVFAIGPLRVDYAGFIRLRINEHVIHTWDIAVVGDAAATLPVDAVPVIFDAFPMIAAYGAKPTGTNREIRVRTTEPAADFVITLTTDAVAIVRDASATDPDLELPAEAIVRLVYGRLDRDHTPAFAGSAADLAELRSVFPGV